MPPRQILARPPAAPVTPLPQSKAPGWFELAAQTLGGMLGVPPLSPEDYSTPEGGQSIDRAGALGELLTMGLGVGTLGAAIRGKPPTLGTIGEGVPRRIPNPIKAYHGSPHDFEQFSLSKIGTGEGAQAYGHGLYFAENQGVAESYKTGGTVTNKYKAGSDLELSLVQQYMNREGSKAGAIKSMRETMKANPPKTPAEQKYWDALKDGADRLEAEKVIPPRLYEVNLHATPDELLDWDKPLSEQPQKVREATLRGYGDVRPAKLPNGRYAVTIVGGDQSGRIMYAIDEPTADAAMTAFREQYPKYASGSDIYHDLQRFADRNPGVASDALKREGIKGIQYLDQGSRPAPYRGDSAFLHAANSLKADGQSADAALDALKRSYKSANQSELQAAVNEAFGTQKGTHNFVIFDDQLIEIAKKYGIPLAAATKLVESQGGTVESR